MAENLARKMVSSWADLKGTLLAVNLEMSSAVPWAEKTVGHLV